MNTLGNEAILNKAYEEMGSRNEKMYKPIIQKIYGPIMKTTFKYYQIDFLGESFGGELKSRTSSYNDFAEIMIGYNKVKFGFEKLDWYKDHIPKYKIYFWFAFKDGLYAWELNKTNYQINGGDSQKRIGGTNKRGKDDYKEHYYIKKQYLTKIDDTSVWIHPLVEQNSKRTSIPEGVCFLKLKK
jgi:hypothetical protein